jgi:arylsulfatase A-like enzyme/Tfp pilus assembly protein PilF
MFLFRGLATILALGWSFAGESPAPGRTTNVIVITIDTLRADHLSCYGYTRLQTPHIDALATDGTRFINAYTPVPITLPAHSAIFTGSYPMGNGMRDFGGNRLSAGIPTLASVLKSRGYTTAAFIGAAVLDRRFGLNQGFDTYFDNFDFSGEADFELMRRSGDQVVDKSLSWLQAGPPQPFMLWVHLYDPHYPYTPPPPYSRKYAHVPYDGAIAFADSQVGRVLEFLRAHHLYDNSLIILCSDHGEGLGEHGEKTHGFFIYSSTTHVPLIFKVPGAVRHAVDREVSLVDVLPTILRSLDLPIPATVQGKSILALILGKSQGDQTQIYMETYLPFLHFGWSPLQGYEAGGWKFIAAPRPELYSTQTDDKEVHNLYGSQKAVAHDLHDRLSELVRRYSPQPGSTMASKASTDPAVMEGLQSLGYLAVSAGGQKGLSGRTLDDPKDRIQLYEMIVDASNTSEQGHYREAIGKLREAQKLQADSPVIPYFIALNYYHLRDFPHAAEGFQVALRLQPGNSLAENYLGLSQAKVGDDEAAIKSFKHVLELDATNYSVAFNLGSLYLKKGQAENAVREFERAIQINPDYAAAYGVLGEIWIVEGNTPKAIQALEKAVQLEPSSPKFHASLGRAYQAAGRKAEAQQQFNRAQSK